MDYTQVIPAQITKLPKYSVPRQLFICTCIVIIIFLILTLIIAIKWVIRTINGYTNTDYIPDYAVKYQAQKTMKVIDFQPNDEQYKNQCIKYSKYQSRMLQFWCLCGIVVINVGTFSCGAVQCVGFGLSVIVFFIFNVLRISEFQILRIAWILPMILCYISYYIYNKRLVQT